jgi:hypothetical protein
MAAALSPATANPAPDTEPASEFGATVADAQRLLRRAKYVYVFFRVGPQIWETELVDVPKAVIARKLKRTDALKPFPCELSGGSSGDAVLLIGASAAIEKAAEARR